MMDAFPAAYLSEEYGFVFFHGCVRGARASSGKHLDGLSWDLFKNHRVVAGDIHVPQRIGPVTYVGAPYPINFGDDYIPRIMVIEDRKISYTRPPIILKRHLRVRRLHELEKKMEEFTGNDQVKVTYILPKSEYYQWQEIRKEIIEICNRPVLCGIEMQEAKRERLEIPAEKTESHSHNMDDLFEDFCKDRGGAVDAYTKEVGKGFLDGNN
jgi:hypothetical protein